MKEGSTFMPIAINKGGAAEAIRSLGDLENFGFFR